MLGAAFDQLRHKHATVGLLEDYWGTTARLLEDYCGTTGELLMDYWGTTGGLLGDYRKTIGRPLEDNWECGTTGGLLGNYWKIMLDNALRYHSCFAFRPCVITLSVITTALLFDSA